MLAVLEAAAGEDHRHVGADVRIGVAEVRAVEDHGAIEQRVFAFVHGLEIADESGEQLHVPLVDDLELRYLALGFAVMREVVIAVGDRGAGDLEHGRADAVEQQGDGAGGIGFESQARDVVHHLHLLHVLRGIRRVDRHGRGDHRLRLALPALGCLQPLLEVADAGEVLVEAITVALADGRLQVLRLAGDGVEDAASGVQFADLGFDLRRAALQEHLLEDGRGFVFRRDRDAGAGPGEAAVAGVDGERQRREARLVPICSAMY